MKLLLENWKRYLSESHNISHMAMDIRDAADEYPEDPKFAIKQLGYNILGIGQGRVIVKIDINTVAKIAYNDNGVEQNEQEYSIWNRTKSDLLVPVYDKFDGYITAAFALPCGEDCEGEIEKRKNIVRKELANAGVQSLTDIHNLMNWGIHNGEVKLLDYGS
jgi:hypothetical protein